MWNQFPVFRDAGQYCSVFLYHSSVTDFTDCDPVVFLVPVIAGISYEIIRLAGRSENILVNLLSKPGLLVQNLTTKEPDDGMIEVGIKAVEAVFDWRAYLEENFPTKSDVENV